MRKYQLIYYCGDCGKSFKSDKGAKFCTYCGSGNIDVNGKARNTALRMIKEHNELTVAALEKFGEYAGIYAKIAIIRETLRTYKHRGVITDEEMPIFKKPTLAEYTAQYREIKSK